MKILVVFLLSICSLYSTAQTPVLVEKDNQNKVFYFGSFAGIGSATIKYPCSKGEEILFIDSIYSANVIVEGARKFTFVLRVQYSDWAGSHVGIWEYRSYSPEGEGWTMIQNE